MKPVELILKHWPEIVEAYRETGSWPKVYDRVHPLKAIGLNTVKQYCSIIIEVKQRLDTDERLDKVKQYLEAVKQELAKREELYKVIQAELYKVKQERDEVKHELDRLRELNKVIQDELDRVKQRLANQDRLDNGLNNAKGLNMVIQDKKQGQVKQKLNIAGWSIQQDRKGYYRAFRKIGGKLRAVYLGKTLDGAESRIREAEAGK